MDTEGRNYVDMSLWDSVGTLSFGGVGGIRLNTRRPLPKWT